MSEWHDVWMQKGPWNPAKRRHFLAKWRQHRGLTQIQFAERIGVTQGQLSKIENFKKPLDEDFVNLAAEELRCKPADIWNRNPSDPESIVETILSELEAATPTQQAQIVRMIQVIKGTGTDG